MPDQLAPIRIFISSPADVRPERLKAEQIIQRLNREFRYYFDIKSVLWEREPLVATRHFQEPENIPPPRGVDIVVVILWSRLGTPLPEDKFRGVLSGRCVSGTEWEFEDALAGARENGGVPHLLVYRKTAELVGSFADRPEVEQRLQQLDRVADFVARWFHSADGQSLSAASHSFADIGEFEQQLYEHLRALLERRAGGVATGFAIRWHEAPFRALLSYEYEHATVFFGRTRASNEIRELLAAQVERGTAFVLVFGASGSGKSSVVKAGVLPDLMLPGMIGRVGLLRRCQMRPSDMGGDCLTALAAAILSPCALPELSGLQYSPERLARVLREAPSQATLAVEQGLLAARAAAGLVDSAEVRLVVIADQLEELFTIDHVTQLDRDTFLAVLEALSRSRLVWVVATIRSDFFDRLETTPALAALSANGRFLLLPPDEAEIGQIIRRPAQEAGLSFERDAVRGLSLDEVILQAAAKDRGALPLLSFLLDQLWQKRDVNGVLTFAAYQALGGLEGAIGSRAEEVFQAQPQEVRDELPALVRQLVTVRGAVATSRAAAWSQFSAGSMRRTLVDAFLHPEARLLVSDNVAGQALVRLAHEALLTHWPRAQQQVADDVRDLELRGRLEHEAELWRSAARRDKPKRVATGLMLAEAGALLSRWRSELPATVRDFILASQRAALLRRLRFVANLTAAVAALPIIALVVWTVLAWWGVRQVEAGLAFVQIRPGCFQMGSAETEVGRSANEGPLHQVCLKAFDLGQFEVSQAQWRQVLVFIDANPAYFSDPHRPVESVSWNDVHRFLAVMSFFGHRHYRLPSEAEWEYTARAGTMTSRYWGDSVDEGCAYENLPDVRLRARIPDAIVAQCDDGYSTTAPVGTYKPNPWQLYDMLSNVAEWVEDCYVSGYRGAPTDGSARVADPCANRVIRGGSWNHIPRDTRAAFRTGLGPTVRSYGYGFRLAATSPSAIPRDEH